MSIISNSYSKDNPFYSDNRKGIEKYIITLDDTTHHITNVISDDTWKAVQEEEMSVIKCSNFKELGSDGKWHELQQWKY